MSGAALKENILSLSPPSEPSDAEIVDSVRRRADLAAEQGGPSDQEIVSGVRGFAREFQYWYNRVLREALPKYQRLIIDRINPMIRGMELEGLSTEEVAGRLVADYAHRNYVTAGGWALEQLAIAGSPRLRKSAAAGMDAEWHEGSSRPVVHLYVIKSGTVTRNSDILKQLKSHGEAASKRLLQTDKKAVVRVYYVIIAGRRTGSYEDGVYRPSSAEFWAQTFALEHDEKRAIDLALAMAQEAGALLRGLTEGAESSILAMQTAVASYIATDQDPTVVDWEFLAQRNMLDDEEVKKAAKLRHERAKKAVVDSGLEWPASGRGKNVEDAAALAEKAAQLPQEVMDELELALPELSN